MKRVQPRAQNLIYRESLIGDDRVSGVSKAGPDRKPSSIPEDQVAKIIDGGGSHTDRRSVGAPNGCARAVEELEVAVGEEAERGT